MTLRYWYDDAGEVRCENRHGLTFTLQGPGPDWRPRAEAPRGVARVTATPLVREAPGAAVGGTPGTRA